MGLFPPQQKRFFWLVQHSSQQALLVSTSKVKLFLKYCCYALLTNCAQAECWDSAHLHPSKIKIPGNFTFTPLGIVVQQVE